MAEHSHFLLVFLDGVGLGEASIHNPLSASESMPFLSELIGQPWLKGASADRAELWFRPIDATLGVAGLPQSATGQTTLYTGQNAPAFLGRHQSGFANGALRQLIDKYGLFSQALALGATATLANAYSPDYFYAIARRTRRYSVCTLLNLSAKLPFRLQYEYDQGKAIFWNIIGETPPNVSIHRPPISPQIAGSRLAALSAEYSVTLFECYLCDYAGHAQDPERAIAYLQRIDRFLESAIAHLPPNITLLLTSDHGNVEDLSSKRHTLNSVPLLAIGPQAQAFAPIHDLTGITPQILQLL
jgi:2,3-bisphosphoglycerate-independent phosphoglycerate mutase